MDQLQAKPEQTYTNSNIPYLDILRFFEIFYN